MKYHFYSDSSHGWLKVKISELEKLNLLEKISHYSYKRGDCAYLEEDCDMKMFMCYKDLNKNDIVEHYTNRSSRIRSYENF